VYQPMRNLNWRRDVRWNRVCEELGLAGLTPHDYADVCVMPMFPGMSCSPGVDAWKLSA
jgi:hypothetical protein